MPKQGRDNRRPVGELEANGTKEISILFIDNVNFGPHLRNALAADRNASREEALIDIYRVMRPGEPPTLEVRMHCSKLFFNSDRWVSSVGRVKMNSRLDMKLMITFVFSTNRT